MARYYKDSREGEERHVWCQEGDVIDDPNYISDIDYAIEIDKDEYDLKMKECYEYRRERAALPSDPIVPADGQIPYDDFNKLYMYTNSESMAVGEYEIDDKIRIYIKVLSSGEDMPPVQAYYNNVLDRYICFTGYHRSCAYNNLEKDIPYIDNMPEAKLMSTDIHIINYKEELELIELDELDSTTLTETQYKELLKLRNQWRKELNG